MRSLHYILREVVTPVDEVLAVVSCISSHRIGRVRSETKFKY